MTKTQTISFVVLNPNEHLEPVLLINHTINVQVDEYIQFLDDNDIPVLGERFIKNEDFYRLGITHNSTTQFEKVWLVFPSLNDFLCFSIIKVAEGNLLRETILQLRTVLHNKEQEQNQHENSDLEVDANMSPEEVIDGIVETYMETSTETSQLDENNHENQ